jgi:hypothetical protein
MQRQEARTAKVDGGVHRVAQGADLLLGRGELNLGVHLGRVSASQESAKPKIPAPSLGSLAAATHRCQSPPDPLLMLFLSLVNPVPCCQELYSVAAVQVILQAPCRHFDPRV